MEGLNRACRTISDADLLESMKPFSAVGPAPLHPTACSARHHWLEVVPGRSSATRRSWGLCLTNSLVRGLRGLSASRADGTPPD